MMWEIWDDWIQDEVDVEDLVLDLGSEDLHEAVPLKPGSRLPTNGTAGFLLART